MKSFLFLFILICLTEVVSAQYVYTIKADSVKLTGCDSAELIIENHTQTVPGFLYNTGNGRTVFKRALQKINDSIFLVGADTLKIQQSEGISASNGLSMTGNVVQLGQEPGATGNPAALTSSREIPLNGNNMIYSSDGSQLALDFNGWLSSPRLLSNNFITIGSASNFVSVAGTTNVTSANDFPVLQLITGSLGNSFDMNFSSVIESFIASGSVGHNQPLLITTSANTVNPYVAGDIIISPGRVQTENFASQISTPYNIDLQPSGTGSVAVASTWNTTSSPTLISANVTNTASGTSAKLMDLQASGASKFSVYANSGNTVIGSTDNGHFFQVEQPTVSGSSSTNSVNIASTWNTTGSPTAFKMNVTDSAASASATIMDIQQDGISRLKIPVNSAKMTFGYSGINLQTPGGTTGGITLNGSPTYGNTICVSKNFNLSNTYGLSGASDALQFTSAEVIHTSGTVNLIHSYTLFQPTSGDGIFNMLNLNSTVNQTGSANGISRGLYINPVLESVADFRAIEIATGKSILNGPVSVNTSATPTAGLLLGAGTAAAGSAPIKLTSGTVLTTPEDGAIEYDGTDYYVTQGTSRFKLSKTLTGQITTDFGAPSVVAGNTTSTTLSVPGVAAGDVVTVNANSGAVNPPSIIITAYVTSADLVTLRAYNAGSSTITLASDTYKVRVIK